METFIPEFFKADIRYYNRLKEYKRGFCLISARSVHYAEENLKLWCEDMGFELINFYMTKLVQKDNFNEWGIDFLGAHTV